MSQFDAVSEIILYVEDMAEMMTFYTDVLGLEVVSGAPEHGFVRFDTGQGRLCLHAGGESDVGSAAPKVVFEVGDLAAARETLESNGVKVGEVRSPTPQKRICDWVDPEGNRFAIEATD